MRGHPAALVARSTAADPSGHSHAVVRASERYGNGTVELLGVQTDRLADVAVWRGHDEAEVAELATDAAAGRGAAARPLDRRVQVDVNADRACPAGLGSPR